ncbi:MAG TPA: O-antigen ligase family protein [Gemmatimonadaceae bacterium]|nr:O-antigen ligase family protein [Gemmatimonadaceae bacterium]
MRALGLVAFTYVWRLQDAFPILGRIKLPILALLLALGYFVTARHPWRKANKLRSPIVTLVLGLLLVMIIGIPTSLWRGHSAQFVLKEHIPNILFMLCMAASIRSVRDVEWFAKLNLYGALMYATIVNLFFHVGPDGRLGDLVYYDANDFALVMVATVPFAVYWLRPGNTMRRRLFGLLALGMFMLALVKSGSRGGFLGFIAVMLYVLLRYRAIPSRLRLLAAIAGVGLVAVLGTDKYWNQMSTILHPQSDYNWSDQEGRIEVWKRGVGYVVHNPVLGVGVGSYPVAEGTLSEIGRQLQARGKGFKWSVAHNSFLETAAELGIPGLLLFIGIFAVTIRTMARIRPGRYFGPLVGKRETALSQMLTGSFVGYSVAGFFVSAEYFSYLFFLLGLAVGLDKVLRLQRAAVLGASPPMMGQRAAVHPAAAPGAPPLPVPRGT